MTINYQVLDKILSDLVSLQDGQISARCEQEIGLFLKNHDMNVFSDNSLIELKYAFTNNLDKVYEVMTGNYLPNIFAKKV